MATWYPLYSRIHLNGSGGWGENEVWTEKYLRPPPANDTANSPLLLSVHRRVNLGIIHSLYILHFNQILSYNKISFVKPSLVGSRFLMSIYRPSTPTQLFKMITEFTQKQLSSGLARSHFSPIQHSMFYRFCSLSHIVDFQVDVKSQSHCQTYWYIYSCIYLFNK